MRESICGDTRVSVLGFGCGSVLGRVGRTSSLRAMNAAWEEGITFFDTARSYGGGEAESVLGEFLVGKRQQAIIATKYGQAVKPLGSWKRIAMPVARQAMKVHRLLRPDGVRAAPMGEFTAGGLRASLETSLRELRTDHVDMLFLHEASLDVLGRHDVMEELDALKRAGKVLRTGLYGAPAVIAAALAQGVGTQSAMQCGADPFAAEVVGEPGMLRIGNHPFHSALRVERVRAVLRAVCDDASVPMALREKLRRGDWACVLDAMFGVLLDGSGLHALVLSMMEPTHVRANAAAVGSSRFAVAEVELLHERLRLEPVFRPAVAR